MSDLRYNLWTIIHTSFFIGNWRDISVGFRSRNASHTLCSDHETPLHPHLRPTSRKVLTVTDVWALPAASPCSIRPGRDHSPQMVSSIPLVSMLNVLPRSILLTDRLFAQRVQLGQQIVNGTPSPTE